MTATAAPSAVMAKPLTAVIVRPALSKESLAKTLMVTAVSSLVVAESLAMSTTGVTVMATVSMSLAEPSLVVRVSTAGPL